jgi:TetR/AcrR family transcriptional regulator
MTSPKPTAEELQAKRRDPEATKADILRVATDEFANNGFNGARVDRIADDVNFRVLEKTLNVDEMDPGEAIRKLAEFTYDHHLSHHDFIRLVQVENINKVKYLKKSPRVKELQGAVISTLESIMKRGVEQGIFRSDIEPFDIHMAISALTVFPVGNQHTIKLIFGRDMLDENYRPKYRKMVGDIIVDTVMRVD